MCNIAGYLGNKQAAPILLEMLRRQQPYDGDMSTGVATIHEGKLHYRKIVGDVDTLIRETDVLSLPGTMGIAHTRPGGSKNEIAYHPFLNMDETMALITNGTTPTTKYCHLWDEAAALLDKNGYVFKMVSKLKTPRSPMLAEKNLYVCPPEVRVFLIDFYLKQGKSITEAMALSCAALYSDNATVMINENFPDRIFALRTTRPLVVAMEGGETYMATTRFGMPQGLGDIAWDLPLFHTCVLSRNGVTVAKEKMEMEVVREMTPYTYHEAYKRFEDLLKSEKAPLYFDELEYAAGDMRDLWPGNHTCVQHARLVYDLLWQFESEGRLRKEIRLQETVHGTRHRYYMWLDD